MGNRRINRNADESRAAQHSDLRGRSVRMRLLKLLLTVGLPGLFLLCWVPFYAAKMEDAYMWRGNLAVAVLYGVVQVLLVRTYRGYEVEHFQWQEITISLSLSSFLCNCIFYVVSFFLCERLVSPIPLLVLQIADAFVCFLWARLAVSVFNRMSQRERWVILYRRETDLKRLDHMDSFLNRFSVEEKRCVQSYSADILAEIQSFDGVLIVGVEADVRNGILKDCVAASLPVYVLPKVGDIILRGAELFPLSGEVILSVNRSSARVEYAAAKRLFDIAVSLLAIILTSPIMLATAVAIKLEDRGPVFYRQDRLTQNGERFRILKYRSMRTDAEEDGVACLSTGENDPRITRVGRIIRRFRIDELPQFFTILSGKMSVVGPRPERPEIAEQYREVMPAFDLRLQVKAGLTGYAQVYGRYNSTPYEKLQMDLVYINRMSITEDLRLVIATVRILLQKESTEGVAEGSVTAMSGESHG